MPDYSTSELNQIVPGNSTLQAKIKQSLEFDGTTAEFEYWQAQAAMLDPDAYRWFNGVFSTEVPAGNGWYVVNAYRCVLNDSGYLTFSVRPCDYRRYAYLSPGTKIRSQTTTPPDADWVFSNPTLAQLYVCDPALVISTDARYVINPRALYFERLATLKTLQIQDIRAISTAGGDYEKYTNAFFPATFENALMITAQAYDTAWVTLLEAGTLASGPNLMSEVNNWHSVRFAESAIAPFKRSQFSGIQTLAANYWGNPYIDPWGTGTAFGDPYNQPGYASIQYYILPTNW